MIETERLILCPWEISDAKELYIYASDKRVSEPAHWPCHESVEMSRKVIEEYFIPNNSCKIVLKETKELVGCIGLVPQGGENYTPADGEREVGYWIGHLYWGKGMATEALEAFIAYCRDEEDMNSLLITTDQSNIASQRVAEKCGFKFVEDYEHEGVSCKAYRLALYAEETDELALLCEYFSDMERQGPGSYEATKVALDYVINYNTGDLENVVDLGCGTGAATLTIVDVFESHVNALDLYPGFIKKIQEYAEDTGITNLLTLLVGDMANLPFAEDQFDLIWSEGAIYNIGFENGLKNWRRYIRKEGFVAVTELTWLTDSRPAEIEEYWQNAYPGIDTVANKVAQMQRSGYKVIGTFVLPEECWTTNYYEPQKKVQKKFLRRHPNSAAAKKIVEDQRHEAELYDKYKDYYGYVFYIGQKKD